MKKIIILFTLIYSIFLHSQVGINTDTPQSTLEVNGSATNTVAYDAGSSTTIDFSKSNLAYTSANPGNFYSIKGIKNGGTYTLAVTGTTKGTATFVTTVAGLTFKSRNNTETIEGTQTLYTFLVIGQYVYVFMSPGY